MSSLYAFIARLVDFVVRLITNRFYVKKESVKVPTQITTFSRPYLQLVALPEPRVVALPAPVTVPNANPRTYLRGIKLHEINCIALSCSFLLPLAGLTRRQALEAQRTIVEHLDAAFPYNDFFPRAGDVFAEEDGWIVAIEGLYQQQHLLAVLGGNDDRGMPWLPLAA